MRRFNASSVYLTKVTVESLSDALIYTVLSIYYVTQANLNPFQLIIVGTLLEVTIFLTEVPTGVVADTFSRRRSIIIGIFLGGISCTMQGFVADFGIILLAQVVRGVGLTFISGADQAWIADEVGNERLGPLFLRGSQYGRIAGLVGIVLSVGLALISLTIPILLSGVLLVGLGVFLVLRMPETGFRPTLRQERSSWQSMGHTFTEGLTVVRGRPLLWSILGVGFFIGAASEGFDRLWEAHLLRDIQFPLDGQLPPVVWFGIMNIGWSILGFLTVLTVSKWVERQMTDHHRTVRLLMVSQGVSILCVIVFALTGNFWLALAALSLRVMLGAVVEPLYNTWLTQNVPSHVRATILSMNSQVNAIGQVAGGPGVGAIGVAFSIRAAITASACLLSPTLLLYARMMRKGGQPDQGQFSEQVGEVEASKV